MNQYTSFLINTHKKRELKGFSKRFRWLAAIVLTIAGVVGAHAFPTDHYAERSVLSEGHWVKISVPSDGFYAITAAQLRQWGFTDPSRVRVYGYGGKRIADVMTANSYIDDLPLVQTIVTKNGSVVFYGAGPETWTMSVTGRYVQSSNIYTTKGY